MTSSVRLWLDWRGIVTLAVIVIAVSALLLLLRSPIPVHIAECRRLYAAAHTRGDSVIVDQTTPQVMNPKFDTERVSCGMLRQLKRL
jgi:hypothetical protein